MSGQAYTKKGPNAIADEDRSLGVGRINTWTNLVLIC